VRPALSVILLTTLIGCAQGLFVALVALDLGMLGGIRIEPAALRAFVRESGLLACALLVAGLAASFFHLGRPERAWRAAAKWRTSWLSREVIVLPAFLAAVGTCALGPGAGDGMGFAAAVIGVVLAIALFVCTGMIYACLAFIAEWRTPLTPLNFALLGMASGFTLATTLAAYRLDVPLPALAQATLVLCGAAAFARVIALLRVGRLKPKTTLQTALGIKHPEIAQRARGFTGTAFNLREFFHGAGPRTLPRATVAFVALGLVAPAIAIAAGLAYDTPIAYAIAFVLQFPGLMIERWCFFAQVRHPQNLYYRTAS